jgi:hypothetical protein
VFPFLYVDADSCADRLLAALRRAQVDVVAANELGLAAIADEDQFRQAVSLGRPILTGNYKDFLPLYSAWAREGRHHMGLLIRRHGRVSYETLATEIATVCKSRTEEEFRNALIWVG